MFRQELNGGSMNQEVIIRDADVAATSILLKLMSITPNLMKMDPNRLRLLFSLNYEFVFIKPNPQDSNTTNQIINFPAKNDRVPNLYREELHPKYEKSKNIMRVNEHSCFK
jgi:hypothetical protein